MQGVRRRRGKWIVWIMQGLIVGILELVCAVVNRLRQAILNGAAIDCAATLRAGAVLQGSRFAVRAQEAVPGVFWVHLIGLRGGSSCN